MCWYCKYGVAKAVAAIYSEALDKLNGNMMPLHFGPAHIVWEDFNFADGHVQWCIDEFDNYKGDWREDQLAVVMWSLEELIKIPEDEREIAQYAPVGEYEVEFLPPKVETVKI